MEKGAKGFVLVDGSWQTMTGKYKEVFIMVVQHNLTAMNSNRMLSISAKTVSKSAEKLSSGYKVNRAADDAAGLSISEKMRKQIRGLTQASLNSEDGISAVQTAEGALTEVHDMLQRMNELAVKASNGTMSEDDRQTIQDEVDQLLTEIDRVAETTKFNETYLLKGDPKGTTVSVTLTAHDAGLAGKFTAGTLASAATATFTATALAKDDVVSIGGTEWTIIATTGNATNDQKANYQLTAADAYGMMKDELLKANNIGASDGKKATVTNTNNVFTITKGYASAVKDLSMSLHVGADADMTNKISVKIHDLSTTGLGIEGLRVMNNTATDIEGANATYAIDAIHDAVARVSAQRSKLGAIQNRLEHTVKNLDNIVENTTAAESQIRDTDMAKEMVKYSNNNILQQAGQSMLAQANQANQGVLSILG